MVQTVDAVDAEVTDAVVNRDIGNRNLTRRLANRVQTELANLATSEAETLAQATFVSEAVTILQAVQGDAAYATLQAGVKTLVDDYVTAHAG